jgi:hypothetical protein
MIAYWENASPAWGGDAEAGGAVNDLIKTMLAP